MKRVALVTAIALSTGSCEFAHKHPAVTAGIAGGFIGLVPCLPAVSKPLTCVEIGAGAGLSLGVIVLLVNTFFNTSAPDVVPDPEADPDAERIHTTTPPPPGPPPGSQPMTSVDAGVPMPDAPSDATPVD